MPRFVILEHDHPTLHWDLMLEDAGRLLTWRLPAAPSDPAVQRGRVLVATPLADHRLAYLNYEGPVSGNRGRVIRREQGTFEWVERTPERITVRVAGAILHGTITLYRAQAPPPPEGDWSFQYAAADIQKPR